MTGNKIYLLCLFDYQCTTGFATVSHNIVRELKKAYGEQLFLDILAINYFGPGTEPDNRTRIYPAAKLLEGTKQQDVYGRTAFLQMLQEGDYDGIFIIQDMGVILEMATLIKEIKEKRRKANRKSFKSVYYFPVDGTPLAEHFENFSVFDKLVVYTEYGRNEILQLLPALKGRLQVILHGVNPGNFYPLPTSRIIKFREDYFGANASKTIITNVNRNQPRKDIPTTILAFQEYHEQYNRDSFLYLHMTPNDPMGWNLYKVMKQTRLKEGIDYMFSPEELFHAGASMETLNSIYNASDLYLTTTSGEGFGLTILEAMMCKCPVVAPLHSSITEISGQGEFIFQLETLYPFCTHFDNMFRWQSDYTEIAEVIDSAITNKEEALRKVEKAYAFAHSITWDKVCRRWIEVFKETFS